jgi:hypothetical protein
VTAATDAAALLADCEREGVPEEYRAVARDAVGRIRRDSSALVVLYRLPDGSRVVAEAALAEAQRRGWVP